MFIIHGILRLYILKFIDVKRDYINYSKKDRQVCPVYLHKTLKLHHVKTLDFDNIDILTFRLRSIKR